MLPHSHHHHHHHRLLEPATNEQPMISANEEFGQGQPHDAITNFEPSLAVAVGLLAIVFSLTVLLLLYFKSCHRNTDASATTNAVFSSPPAGANALSGLDKKAIQSLPFFRFGALRGSKDGLECAVCLSKYEESEILRLLPNCRHAFHVDCVDRWLSQHSTCPLCRTDAAAATGSSLLARSFSNQENPEESISNGDVSASDLNANDVVELFVEREEDQLDDRDSAIRRSPSKFSIGSSFRRMFVGGGGGGRGLHKHNHKIVFSDVVFKNRWSNVSSSDLIFLKSEMVLTSDVGDEIETMKRESVELAKRDSNASSAWSPTRALLNSGGGGGDSAVVEGRRSVSEITMYSRCKEIGDTAEEEGEEKRKIWFPIARKTVEWFANGRGEETGGKGNRQRGLDAV